MPHESRPDPSLADETTRLRARVAELERQLERQVERQLASAAPEAVRYALDGRPLPTTSRRVFGRLVTVLLFLLGIGLGFGFAMRNPDLRHGFQDGMRNPSPGAEVPPPSPPP